jgi:DNA-binding GntR family transcriptional regulator
VPGLAEPGLAYRIPNRGIPIKKVKRDDAIEVYDMLAALTELLASLLGPILANEKATQFDTYVDEM